MSIRTRTTPETVSVDITTDRIERFELDVAYNNDGTVDKENTVFHYTVSNVNSDGSIADRQSYVSNVNNWPTVFRNEMKTIRNLILTDAENRGFIGAGTNTETFDAD